MNDRIAIRVNEILVGDVILTAISDRGGLPWTDIYTVHGVTASSDGRLVLCLSWPKFGGGTGWNRNYLVGPDIKTWVIRLRAASTAVRDKPAARVIDDFPHSCTRCGGRAYVGLFEVTHMAADTSCPARRA